MSGVIFMLLALLMAVVGAGMSITSAIKAHTKAMESELMRITRPLETWQPSPFGFTPKGTRGLYSRGP